MDAKKIILILVALLVIAGVVGFMLFNPFEEPVEKLNDTATNSKHSDIWKTSNSIISRENNGTLISRGQNNSWFYLYLNPGGTGSNFIHKAPFTVEFDIINETYRSLIEFRDQKGAVSNFEFNSLNDRGVGHWKILVNTTSQQYYHDGDLVKTDNQTFSDGIRIGFVGIYKNSTNSTSTLKFANFKKY